MSAPAEYDASAEYQRRCLEVAREIATLPIDATASARGDKDGPTPGPTIDETTRDAARAFLRAEFQRWTEEGEPDEYEQADTDGQHEPA